AASTSSRSCSTASRPASSDRLRWGWAATRSAATRRASGREPQSPARSAAAAGSAAGRRGAGGPARTARAGGGAGGAGGERGGAVRHDEAAEPVGAGDNQGAGGAAGKQGADLVGGGCVTQNDERAFARQHAAVQAGPAVQVVGNLTRVDLKRSQQMLKSLLGRQRRFVGVKAPQVEIELPVSKAVGYLVGGVDRNSGFADPGGAAEA